MSNSIFRRFAIFINQCYNCSVSRYCTIYCCKSYDYLELIRYSIRFLRICRICSDYIFVVLECYCDVFIDNCYILY